MSFYVGNWRLVDDDDGQFWTGPSGFSCAFDLRLPGETTGRGLFYCPSGRPGSDYKQIADSLDERLTDGQRRAIAVRGLAGGDDLFGCLLSLVTDHADPMGNAGLRPLAMTSSRPGRAAFTFAGRRRLLKVNEAHFARCIKCVEIAVIKTLDVDEALARKQLGFELQKHGVDAADWRSVITDETARAKLHSPAKPESSQTDDFNRANETPLASPWVRRWGSTTVNLASNRCDKSGNGDCVYTRSVLSGSDMFVDFLEDGSGRSGPAARWDGTTGYYVDPTSTSSKRLYKSVSGSKTLLAQGSHSPLTSLHRLTVDGSTQELKSGVTVIASATDTAIASGLYPGIYLYKATGFGDDFYAEDIAAAGNPARYYQQQAAAIL